MELSKRIFTELKAIFPIEPFSDLNYLNSIQFHWNNSPYQQKLLNSSPFSSNCIMLSRRVCSAAPRAVRYKPSRLHQQARFQSSSAGGTSSATSHLAAGIAGGLIGTAVFTGIYSYTPAGQTASKLNKAAVEATKQYKIAADKLQNNTPNADQAINSIKEFAYSYVGWIPGGRSYIDAIFKDVDLIREKHKEEADEIVNDAYKKLQKLSKEGLSMEALSKTYEIIAELSQKIGSLSGDVVSDIIDNHPKLKENLGGNVDKLKELGDKFGPDAKKQVEDTWKEVKEIFSGGLGAASLAKAKKLIDEKVEQIQQLGDKAWDSGMEELKPLLEKNSKVKKLIEENQDALKQGNVKELFDKAKSAIESKDSGKLEEYVNKSLESAKSKGSEVASSWNLDEYFKLIPGGAEILPKLQEIKDFTEQHKEEGEKLLKETIEELKGVLEKKAGKAQELVDSAKKDAKSKTDSKSK